MKRAWNALETFFLEPATARPIAALRIGLALVLLLQAFMLRGSLVDLFGGDGIVQGDLARILMSPSMPRISTFTEILSPLGLAENSVLLLTGLLYVFSLLFLLLGFYSRVAAIAAWFLHWVFMSSGETTSYGVDLYAHVFLFYLIFAPAGAAYSLDRTYGRVKDEPSSSARLVLRVMQLQLCITYFMSFKDKALGEQWWNGELMWRVFTVPLYQSLDFTWLAHFPLFLKLGGWMSLLLEGAYFIFIWPKRTRWLWIAGMMALHGGIAVFMGLQLFGLIMCVLTFTVFGFSAEPEEARVELPAWFPARLNRLARLVLPALAWSPRVESRR